MMVTCQSLKHEVSNLMRLKGKEEDRARSKVHQE